MCRLVVAALVLSVFAASTACKDDPAPTEIDVEIFSSIARLDRIHLKVRDQSVDRDRGYSWAELDVDNVGDRDLTTTPALVRLSQTDALKGKPFLLYVTGFVNDAASGTMRVTVGGAITLQYVENQRQVKRIRLNADFLATDRDNDGFRTCGSFQPPTDPAEQNALDDAKNCDCNDNNDRINGFNLEICGDNIDNNCTGWPYDENCADCVADQPCTTLPPEQWGLAGVGECTLGVFRCVDTVVDGANVKRLLDVCEGSKGPVAETVNGRDDNCNGVADELTPCIAGTPARVCYNGFIETAATELAKGECRTGLQSCSNGVWENQCVGQKLPQRPPRDNNEQERADPSFWSGIGFFELAIPTRNFNQCDGLDNDCDGFFDEEQVFDVDGDGYTTCGTGGAPAVNREHTVGGLFPHLADCNDNDAAINPGATELCSDGIDNDCSCDHGPNSSGDPTTAVSGRDCFNADTYLDCSRRDGRASSDPGGCDPTAGGSTVYYSRFANSPTRALRLFGCFPCRASYGYTCGASQDTCASQSEGCCVDNACPDSSLTDAADASHAPVVYRPICGEPDAGTCTCTTPPSWHGAVAGTEPSADGVRLDDREDCGAISCATYYLGVNATDGRCYRRADIPPEESNCLGNRLCATGENPSGANCCDGTTGENCCDTAGQRCPTRTTRGAEADPGRTTCRQVISGCSDSTPPQYGPVPVNTDPFGDCGANQTCDGAGACKQVRGTACVNGSQCATGFCSEEGACCESACGTACQECTVANGGLCRAIVGTKADDSTCNGDCTFCNGGTCATKGVDQNDECTGTCTYCDGTDRGQGASCITPPSRAGGLNCNATTSYCCAGTCVTPGAELGQGCGTGDCGGGTWQCGGAAARCTTQGAPCANCNGDNTRNGTCSTDGTTCNASDAACPACQSCVDNGNNATCSAAEYTNGEEDTSGPNTCTTPSSCDGTGTCRKPQGATCSSGAECISNNCADGRCCNEACGGSCRSCALAGLEGTCSPVDNGADPGTCGGESFCCGGSCVNPPGTNSLNQNCNGHCGGTWMCSGTNYRCSTQGNGCGFCLGDTALNGTCNQDGNCPTVDDCDQCKQCVDRGATADCNTNYGNNSQDNTSPNICSGSQACDGNGNCQTRNGQSCGNNSECISNCCDDNGTGGCSGFGVCR